MRALHILVFAFLLHGAFGFLEKLIKFLGVEKIYPEAGSKNPDVVPLDSHNAHDGNLHSPLTEPEYSALLSTANSLFMLGKSNEAIDNLLQVLEDNPHNFQANKGLGIALMKDMKRPDLAEAFLFRALTTSDYKDIVSISQLAIALINNGDKKLAERVVLEGLRRNSKGSDLFDQHTYQDLLGQVLGMIYAYQGEYTKSSDWYMSAAVAGSTRLGDQALNENVWLKASTLQFPKEHINPVVAKSVLLEALRFHPLNAVFVYQLGVATHMEGSDIELAATFYRQAIELDKKNLEGAAEGTKTAIPDAWAGLGTALFAQGMLQEAHICFDKAMLANPTNYIMLANWAKLLCMPSVSYFVEAEKILNFAKSVAPDRIDVKNAEELCQKAIQTEQEEL